MMQLFSIWAITKVWGNNLFLNFKLRGHSPKTDMSLPLADFNLILVAIKFSFLFGSISSNNLGLIIVTLDPVSTNIVISLLFYLPFNEDSFVSLFYIPNYTNLGGRAWFL